MSTENAPLDLGELPIDLIWNTLGIELEPGRVRLSEGVRIHIKRRHPDDYARCLPFIGSVVASPLYMGDDFKNPGKIEFVSRLPAAGGGGTLVAISLTISDDGWYELSTFYPVSKAKIENRRAKNHLKSVVRK